MIYNSNVEKPNVFEWFQTQILENTMLFNDFEFKCWKTQCFLMIPNPICLNTTCFSMIYNSNVEKPKVF